MAPKSRSQAFRKRHANNSGTISPPFIIHLGLRNSTAFDTEYTYRRYFGAEGKEIRESKGEKGEGDAEKLGIDPGLIESGSFH